MPESLFKLKIADIMKEKIITSSKEETVMEAAKKMKDNNIGSVLIIENNKLIGIFSERDIFSRVVLEGKNPKNILMSEVMTSSPRVLSSDTFIADAFKLTSDGKFRHIPIVDSGKLRGIISVRDINKAFYYEREVLGEMKTKFTMTTSHELKTPTAIIMGCIQLLRRHYDDLTPEQKNLYDIIERNTKRLGEILINLRKLYLGTPPSLEDDIKLSSVKKAVDMAVEDVKEFIKKRNQELSIEIQGNLPEALIEKNSMRQVLVNLLLNAIRFTRDEGKIIIRARDADEGIRVEVEDNGIGIPSDKLEHIFESFYEVQDINKHSSGSIEFGSSGMGVGLTIVKNIIEAHKGRIWAESELNKYSKFIFIIPKA